MNVRFGVVGPVAVVFLFALLLAACEGPDAEGSGDEGPQFLVTIPPLGMIMEPLVAGRGSVQVLLEPGDSPHTYEPTPSDLRMVSDASVVVAASELLDGWVTDLAATRPLTFVDLLPQEARRSFADTTSLASDDTPVDPHFWTDPHAVMALLPALTDTLCAIDAAGCSTYRANADSMVTDLTVLDAQLKTTVEPVREVSVLLAQPFFRYFLARYGPQFVGVINRTPAREPSPRQVQRLVDQVQGQEVRAILIQRQRTSPAAEAVAEATGLPLVALDPLGGTEERATYEELLLGNAQILVKALEEGEPEK